MSWKQLFSGTTIEAFRALEKDEVIKAKTEEAEAQTENLWFSQTFSDAADYSGTDPRGISGQIRIVLDIKAPETEIEDEWSNSTQYSDTTLTRDTKHSEYFRTESYPSDWVEGYWKIDELPMGRANKKDFQYIELN